MVTSKTARRWMAGVLLALAVACGASQPSKAPGGTAGSGGTAGRGGGGGGGSGGEGGTAAGGTGGTGGMGGTGGTGGTGGADEVAWSLRIVQLAPFDVKVTAGTGASRTLPFGTLTDWSDERGTIGFDAAGSGKQADATLAGSAGLRRTVAVVGDASHLELVTLDAQMPAGDGWELVRVLQGSFDYPDLIGFGLSGGGAGGLSRGELSPGIRQYELTWVDVQLGTSYVRYQIGLEPGAVPPLDLLLGTDPQGVHWLFAIDDAGLVRRSASSADAAQLTILDADPLAGLIELPEETGSGEAAYGSLATATLDPGDHRLIFRTSGDVYREVDVTAGPLDHVLLIFMGSDTPYPTTTIVEQPGEIPADTVRLRLISASPSRPGATLRDCTDPTQTADIVQVTTYGDISVGADVKDPHWLCIDTDGNGSFETILGAQDYALPRGASYTFFQVEPNDTPRLGSSMPYYAWVSGTYPVPYRILNLSPDAGPMDVYFDGVELSGLAGTKRGDFPAPFSVPMNASNPFVFVPAGKPVDASWVSQSVTWSNLSRGRPGMVLAGRKGGLKAVEVVEPYYAAPEAGQMDMYVVHAAPDAGSLTVRDRTPGAARPDAVLVSGARFGSSSHIGVLQATGAVLGMDVDGDGVVDHTFALPDLTALGLHTAYLAEDPDGTVFLLVDDASTGLITRIDG